MRFRNVTQAATGTGNACPPLVERGTTCTPSCTTPPPPPIVPIGTACAGIGNCASTRCSTPIAGATCAVSGAWTYTGNVNVASLAFVGCNLAITGSLTGSATSNLRIHACAKITTTMAYTLAGRLSLDVYNITGLRLGTRVSVVESTASISGTFSTVLVTGFSVNDAGTPFRAGYTPTLAYVDFGTAPPGTITPGVIVNPPNNVPNVAAPTSGQTPAGTLVQPPVTSTTVQPPVTGTVPPPPTTTVQSPVTSTTVQSPVTSTTVQSPGSSPATTIQVPAPPTTTVPPTTNPPTSTTTSDSRVATVSVPVLLALAVARLL